jgi:hypothetical protein
VYVSKKIYQFMQISCRVKFFTINPLTACPSASTSETITTATVVPTTVGSIPGTSAQPYITPQQVACAPQVQTPCSHVVSAAPIQTAHHCQSSCTQHQQLAQTHQQQVSHQVQAATQTPQTANEAKKPGKAVEGTKVKKGGRVVRHQNQNLQGNNFQQNQNYQVGPNNAGTSLLIDWIDLSH